MTVIRLGAVPYLAGRPCVEGLEREPLFDVVRDVPSALVEGLRAATVDVALVSSIEGFRRPGYRYVRGVCIGAEREVRSVLLFARKPLEKCETLALDPASRTGAALAQIVLAANGAPHVRAVETRAGGDPARAGADAYIRIGDAALRHAAQVRASAETVGSVAVHDLAAEWRRVTGLPFVFAVWLVRPGAEPERAHADALLRARERGTAAAAALAEEYAKQLELPAQYLESYLKDACRYDLGAPGMEEAMMEFGRRAQTLGLAEPGVAPRPLEF